MSLSGLTGLATSTNARERQSPPMSQSGLATNTNAAYEIRKERESRESQDLYDNDDLAVQGQPPSPQPQSGVREYYEVPDPREQFPPPAVASNQNEEGEAQEEAVYEPILGK